MLDLKLFDDKLDETLNISFYQSQYLNKILLYRQTLYPILEEFLSVQSQSEIAQKLQAKLDEVALNAHQIDVLSFFELKFQKSKVLASFIDQLLNEPSNFGISFIDPPSNIDKIWVKTLLIHDFIYYGPITFLIISRILERFEDIKSNPVYQMLLNKTLISNISEIRINNFQTIFIDAANKSFDWQIKFLSNDQLVSIIERIISESNLLFRANIKINSISPIADFEHPCGYIRGSAILPPASEEPFMTLRIHPGDPYALDDLMNFNMFDEKMRDFFLAMQKAGTTVAIAGTMGSGKTTLLSALAEHWPLSMGRKATIEDTPELRPRIDDLVKMRTIEYDSKEQKDIDVTRLTKACKRHSVRYVVLSEARDGSAWEILQLSQSILGCLMTFHYTLRSNKFLVDQALNTLASLCKQHPLSPQGNEIKHLLASMVQILLLVEQSPIDKQRRVTNVFYVTGFDEMNGGHFKAIELFKFNPEKGYEQSNFCEEIIEYFKSRGVDYKW